MLLTPVDTSLICPCFLKLSIAFPKITYLPAGKMFFNIIFFHIFISLFISTYGSSQDVWLNLMTQCTFFKTNQWFTACFSVIWITYLLSCNLVVSFPTFSITILSCGAGKWLWRSCLFSGYWTSILKQYLSWLFLLKLFINWHVFSTYFRIFMSNFRDIAHQYKLFPWQYLWYNNSLLLS